MFRSGDHHGFGHSHLTPHLVHGWWWWWCILVIMAVAVGGDICQVANWLVVTLQVIGFHPEDKKYMLLEPLGTASLIEFCQGEMHASIEFEQGSLHVSSSAEPATRTDGQTSAGVIDDTYPRFYKSAPLPVKPKEGHVTFVVGSTFNEIVLSPDKDVLLMVYSSVW